ncbi:HNH endonuclease [Nitrosomonas sp. Is37]|uniref:HNH endonuclease n=1 Tax=Nitrosomonas sp. Is37 TaxID=3080535 RepID=UPI00294B67DA|nr:HNH endonuclease [Nitrosomonas sp. Is37]
MSYPSLIDTLTQNPDEAETIYAMVRVRGIQQILFRDAVRKAYGLRCAFSGTQFPDALDACHIIPWAYATPQQRMDVRNGLLLNPLHHRLFDKAYLTVTTDYRIVYRDPKGSRREHSKIEAALTIKLHNQPMNVPRLSRLRPLAEYIRRHNELIDWQTE